METYIHRYIHKLIRAHFYHSNEQENINSNMQLKSNQHHNTHTISKVIKTLNTQRKTESKENNTITTIILPKFLITNQFEKATRIK